MQFPNQRVFSLNSAVTPEVQWGTVDPSEAPSNITLAAMPVGSLYIQQIGSPAITSGIAWVKVLSDIVAAQNLVSPWTSFSQARVASDSVEPDFDSDEFMLYQPGMVYVHNETKDTGVYRTAWMKVANGGTRSDWISIAESESLERVIASITATELTTDIAEAATLTWRYLTTGTPVVLEEEPDTAGMVGDDLRLTIPASGLYQVEAGCFITNGAQCGCHVAIAVNGAFANHLDSTYMAESAQTTMMSGSRMIRLAKDDVVGLAVAVQAGNGAFTLTDMSLSIMLVAP